MAHDRYVVRSFVFWSDPRPGAAREQIDAFRAATRRGWWPCGLVWLGLLPIVFFALPVWAGEDKPAGQEAPAGTMLGVPAAVPLEPLQSDHMSEADLRQLQKQLKLSDEDFQVFREEIRREEGADRAERKARQETSRQATHEQTAVIRLGEAARGRVNNFCLHPDGRLLVCCGTALPSDIEMASPSGDSKPDAKRMAAAAAIVVADTDGRVLDTWPLTFTPQAICAHRDGTVFVGGDAKVARLDAHGKVLGVSDAPGVLLEKRKKLADEAVPGVDDDVPGKKSESTAEKAESEMSVLEAFFNKLSGRTPEQRRAEEEAVEAAHRRYEQAISGLAVTDTDLFVASRGSSGYAVYRIGRDFQEPKRILDRLSGCCGQMDIQAVGADLIVAENGRHRVSRYDRDGKSIVHWGSSDRSGTEGFGGCCNPKNVRPGPGDVLYTAESGPERLKRYAMDGQLLDLIAVPDFGGGCMRITVDATADGNRVFVLNSSENTIHVYTRKAGK